MLHFDSSHPIVTRGSRVSRAPPPHTLPAFLNLNGNTIMVLCPEVIQYFQLSLKRQIVMALFKKEIIFKNDRIISIFLF